MTLNPFRGKEQKSSSGVNTATSSKSDKSASSTPTVRYGNPPFVLGKSRKSMKFAVFSQDFVKDDVG